jgi:D-alanyl-D-alanine carboxypeptidase
LTTAGPALLAIGSPTASAAPAHAAAPAPELPAAIRAVMDKPRYQDARCSQLVVDVKSGETVHALDPDRVSFTGSTRKLLSVGVALDALGAGTGSRPGLVGVRGPDEDVGRLSAGQG